jgi:YbgC/YbaW family acyl-CoA thioester hydrolase
MSDLDAVEVRVLGCLLEKQQTTPDAYPLTLNSLRLACNQTTNRDPVVEYEEPEIREALQRLGYRRWTRLASGAGSRAPKYRHLLDEALGLQADQQAVLAVLLLRGPQTLGELKQRTERMHRFSSLEELSGVLDRIRDRGLGRWLDRRPGQKEARYEHTLGGAERVESAVSSQQSADSIETAEANSADSRLPTADYPFVHHLRVRYNECDPQNVVFNANYFTYFDITITELWREAFGSYEAMVEAGSDLMVVEARARYLTPARFDDELEIGAGFAHLGTTSIRTHLLVRRNGEAVTEGDVSHVFIDPQTQTKREPPADLRSALERYVLPQKT